MKSAQGREREKIGFIIVLIAGFLLIFGHAHAQVSVNGVSTELSPVAAGDTPSSFSALANSGGDHLCYSKNALGGSVACALTPGSGSKCTVNEIFVTYIAPSFGTYGSVECDLDFGTYGHPFILNTNSQSPAVYLSNPVSSGLTASTNQQIILFCTNNPGDTVAVNMGGTCN